ncbi:unnamed protein product [Bursaphelenchus xylophilus]|uniref:(pine wood nematode) hypothetical protein n=1 Tax=Bursaphelenchus xylophilus TaxID=6326 RepID=A0A7I8WZG4_BURXY|nr:unnamed protein product [Bursaphelenchus xylophilus]CAG9129355.1 unnamed protein product [Bursaphelenchus xylophilus]
MGIVNGLMNSWLKGGKLIGEYGGEYPRTSSPTSFCENPQGEGSDPKNTKSDNRERTQKTVTTDLGISVGPPPIPASFHFKSFIASCPLELGGLEDPGKNGQGKLFKDEDFDFCDLKTKFPQVKFKRPSEIVPNPQFFVKNFPSQPCGKAQVGDVWFLPAVSVVAGRHELFEKVVNISQTFEASTYTGTFRFNFWWYGDWVNVIVDDRLPMDGEVPMFSGCSEEGFWMALLEKAYAKLVGSYEPISCVSYPLSLLCLTGGLVSEVHRSEYKEEEFEQLRDEHFRGLLLLALTSYDLPLAGVNGLIPNQAQAVTGFATLEGKDGKPIRLVRLRNPWSSGAWKGDWSDKSEKWHEVRDEDHDKLIKEKMPLEYWIEWSDFTKYFERLAKCFISPEVLIECADKEKAKEIPFSLIPIQSQWNYKKKSAGGAPGIAGNRFQRNPQFVLNLSNLSDSQPEEKIPVIFNLLLKYGDSQTSRCFPLGLVVYKVPEEETGRFRKFDAAFFNDPTNPAHYVQKIFKYCGSCEYIKLDPGVYVFVPTAYEEDDEGSFFLRLAVQGKAIVSDLD